MSLFGSFYSAISGLNNHGTAMGVIGDNLANMNTIGYKRSRASFQDMMAYPVIGVGTESYIGRGAKLQKIEQVMNQGSFINTGNGMDLAIQGNGFFVVKGQVAGQNSNFFTRAGQFHVDKDGNMVTQTGLRLQGYLADSSGKMSSVLSDLKLKDISAPANATSSVEMSMNLTSSETAIPAGFDLTDIDGTAHHSTSITVYDSLGAPHDMTVYFTKTADHQWQWNAVVEAEDSASGVAEIQASGTLDFDSDGRLVTSTPDPGNTGFNFANGATANQAIDLVFGDPLSEGGSGLAGTTQFASAYSVTFQSQDGFPTGDLQTVVVDADGAIEGTFTNGERRVLGHIALADFKGVGLRRMGSNLWQETAESGEPLIGAANSGRRGGIASSTLEQSNVDLAQEFVDMITAQRGYQANSRTITTADQLFQEALNMKR